LIPETTGFCNGLKLHGFKATFFCVGSNAKKYPNIVQELLCNGHCIGNHTYNHLNGWKNSTQKYAEDVLQCDKTLPKTNGHKLFRPPFGKATKAQFTELEKDYKIVMWDFIIGDFDPNLDKKKSLQLAISSIKPGSIVVFHDSLNAFKNLKYILPKYLEAMEQKGLVSVGIPDNIF